MGIAIEKSLKQEKPSASGRWLISYIFEGGDREWFFIYPKFIISAICEENVSQIYKKSKKYDMKIKSDTLLNLKTKCGKVNLSCFCILQKRISTAPVRRKITRFLKETC